MPELGRFEFSDPTRDGTGKGAFLVTEQFQFKEVFRNGGAVEGNKWFAGAARAAMDVAGEDLLSGAELTGDEYRRFRGGDLGGATHRCGHDRVVCHHGVIIARGSFENCSNQFEIGGRGQKFPCAVTDGAGGKFGV